MVKGIFVTRDRPFFFPVKCEMAIFFLVNRDFHSSREAWFYKLFSVKREINVLFAVNRDFHYAFVFRELWKDRFIFWETWSRPPFTTLFLHEGLHLSLENEVKMSSKRRIMSLIFVIKCIPKCFLLRNSLQPWPNDAMP